MWQKIILGSSDDDKTLERFLKDWRKTVGGVVFTRYPLSIPFDILSQSFNATVLYFDNISFLAHVLNQLFLPNESSISQASYRTKVLTIFSNCSSNKPFYGCRVVENEMHGDVPVSDMRYAFRAS